MNVDVAALLAAIDENPDDDGRYLVLADALTLAGDPHGELIVLQHTLARKPDREVLRAEQAARRAPWPEYGPYRATIYEATWRLASRSICVKHSPTWTVSRREI